MTPADVPAGSIICATVAWEIDVSNGALPAILVEGVVRFGPIVSAGRREEGGGKPSGTVGRGGRGAVVRRRTGMGGSPARVLGEIPPADGGTPADRDSGDGRRTVSGLAGGAPPETTRRGLSRCRLYPVQRRSVKQKDRCNLVLQRSSVCRRSKPKCKNGQGTCIDAGDHKGRPYGVGECTIAQPRAAGPTERMGRPPLRTVETAAAAPGGSAEGGYPPFCPFWSRPFSGKGSGAARAGPLPVGNWKTILRKFASFTQNTCTLIGHNRLFRQAEGPLQPNAAAVLFLSITVLPE